MPLAQVLLIEFDHEMATTRRLLERVPEDRADYRPHPKSFNLGDLAEHVAQLPYWGVLTVTGTELDLASANFPARRFEGTARLLEKLDANVAKAREAIGGASDDDLRVTWTLKRGGNTLLAMPRARILRTFMLNHHIHHRGQLSVYMRELDVPLPPMYGPTADEGAF
ncbi:MAG TPA: DinB family protein [Thermoanaerobaculia bacterium]|nr:DinB family protein [Thermoanaerobaculia bacterium]